jgi:hypothetical protein
VRRDRREISAKISVRAGRERCHTIQSRLAHAAEANSDDSDARLLQCARRVRRGRRLVLAVLLAVCEDDDEFMEGCAVYRVKLILGVHKSSVNVGAA